MKILKTASGNKLKISKKEWKAIGEKNGWNKEAQFDESQVDWSQVDWSKGNSQIADEIGCFTRTVSEMRRKYAPFHQKSPTGEPHDDESIHTNNPHDVHPLDLPYATENFMDTLTKVISEDPQLAERIFPREILKSIYDRVSDMPAEATRGLQLEPLYKSIGGKDYFIKQKV